MGGEVHRNTSEMRRLISSFLVILLVASLPAQTPHEDQIRRQIAGIGQGYLVEIRLLKGGNLTGRIGPIAERDFVLEEVRERKFQDQTVAFADVKAVKRGAVKGMSRAARIAIAAGTTLGTILLIRLIVRRR
jgi:hypothetical protein